MADRLEIRFELSRQDWLAANSELIESSEFWAQQARTHRRRTQRMMLALSPLIVIGASIFIGRSQGMYVEGAIAGAILAALMFWGLPGIDVITPLKKQAREEINRADFSNFVGQFVVAVDHQGLDVTGPSGHTRALWHAVAIQPLAGHIFFHYNGGGIIIPRHALGDPATAQACVAQAQKWCAEGQRPPHEHVWLYLADRDVACPGCGYNLRGIRGQNCPECSAPLTVDRLQTARHDPPPS